MPFVTRDEDGRVIGISELPLEEDAEILPADAPEVAALLARLGGATMVEGDSFLASDLDFIRVLEDLVEVMLRKGLLTLADLPEAAQDKLMERRAMRHWLAGNGQG